MAKGHKTIINQLRSIFRRAWSFPQFRIVFMAFSLLFILFIFIHNGSGNDHNNPLSIKLNQSLSNTHDKIACLILGDPRMEEWKNKELHAEGIEEIFYVLEIYDKYLSPHCSVKVFLVNSSISSYYYSFSEISAKLPNSEIIFIPSNDFTHWEQRRLYTMEILSYVYTNYLNEYEWYLKFYDIDNLVLVDNFANLIYDMDVDMDKAQILGHAIKYNKCIDFIYSLSVYAINNKFIQIIGSKAKYQLDHNKYPVSDNMECSTSKCAHHHEDDYPWACLDDLNIVISPLRDDKDREYFLIFQIRDHYEKMNEWKANDWYWIGKNKKSIGNNCCAKYPVVFSNYLNTEKLRKMYQLIYMEKPEDRTIKFLSKIRYFDNSDIKLPPNVTMKWGKFKPRDDDVFV